MGIAESNKISIFSVVRALHTDFHSSCNSLHFHQQLKRVPFPPQYHLHFLFDFIKSNNKWWFLQYGRLWVQKVRRGLGVHRHRRSCRCWLRCLCGRLPPCWASRAALTAEYSSKPGCGGGQMTGSYAPQSPPSARRWCHILSNLIKLNSSFHF